MLETLAVYGKDIVVDLGTVLKPQVILNDLSVHIPQGCIYGLIGPSGSGKTSFQRTIIGVYKINSGSLSVFGQTPGAKGSCVPGPLIGYMPQEIALDDELTPKELLTFLGKCAGLKSDSTKSINDKINEILSIMDIDCQDRRTSAFSVGQRRRLSLACTLIHSPKLLLLDEPTVGSDIVVVKKIWDYLRYLSDSQGTTIVISTHYLEEVTKADYFGFMSKGRMLVEGQPKPFMEFMGAITFEQAIIKHHYNSDQQSNQQSIAMNLPRPSHFCANDKLDISFNQKRLHFCSAVLLSSSRYLQRWKTTLSLPFLCMIFFVILVNYFVPLFYGRPMKGMNLAYFDLSNSSNYLQNITNYLSTNGITSMQVYDELSGRYLIENQKVEGYFIVPYDFDAALKSRVLSPFNEINEADQLAGRLILYQDAAPAIKPEIIRQKLGDALVEVMENIASEAGKWNKLEYIKIEGIIKRLDEPERLVSKPIALIRLFVFCFECYTLMLLTYWTVNESREPMTERLMSLGLKKSHLVTAFITLSTVFLVPSFLGTIVIGQIFLDIPMIGNWTFVILITTSVVICGICKALLLGFICASNVDCLVGNIFYSGIAYVLGCCISPYESLVYYAKPLAYAIPHVIPSSALLRIMIYGNGLSNPDVLFGVIYSLIMAAIHIVVTYRVVQS